MGREMRDLARARERQWRRHLERQRRSGESVRGYCRAQGLNESAFYFWRRTIAERDREKSRAAFVPVLIQGAAGDSSSAIDIHLGRGRRVRVRSGCSRELLAAVLGVVDNLEERSC